MYIHLGNDYIINDKEILGIFDIENTSIGKATKDFLANAEKQGNVIYTSYEMPKSFIVCNKNGVEKVYVSQLSPSTLRKRNDFNNQMSLNKNTKSFK